MEFDFSKELSFRVNTALIVVDELKPWSRLVHSPVILDGIEIEGNGKNGNEVDRQEMRSLVVLLPWRL
eukprot:scaffold1034_cov127-Cylindrotheca_fusiformis.AAC.4